MKKKFNWGWKIGLMYGSFAILMILMVSKASSEKVDLVTKNYYEEELRYQQHIDRMRLADSLHLQPHWAVDRSDIYVRFPGHTDETISGLITFYCPADAHRDFEYPISTIADSMNHIAHAKLSKGVYRVNTTWHQLGRDLYSESVIKIE